MRHGSSLRAFFACGILCCPPALGEPVIPDASLRERVDELSASTMAGGAGWRSYERLLHRDYSRWAMGEVYEGREKFVRSLEEWWDYGMRVSSRDIEIVGVDLSGDTAIIRFLTHETFSGPNDATGGFSGYVTNIWVREDGAWKLLAAEISSTTRDD